MRVGDSMDLATFLASLMIWEFINPSSNEKPRAIASSLLTKLIN